MRQTELDRDTVQDEQREVKQMLPKNNIYSLLSQYIEFIDPLGSKEYLPALLTSVAVNLASFKIKFDYCGKKQ